jgi:shikimate kinase
MNIVLIGYRGTGKSAVGQILAARLNKTYAGMDTNIVRRAGRPIPEIVEKYGWPGFREIETQEVLELAAGDDLVIDTGGGVVERPENIPALQKNGFIVWLKASVETIVARIQGDDQRPALTAGRSFTEEVAEVLSRRRPLYQQAAQYAIDTDTLTVAQVAEAIIRRIATGADR